jgi:hypothetical protein
MSEENTEIPESPKKDIHINLNNSTREIPESKPTKSNEKIACDCGKIVMRKNIAVHEATAHHKRAMKELKAKDEPKPSKTVKTESTLKIKQEFDNINEKLGELLDAVLDIYDVLIPPEEDEEENEEIKK